MQKAEFIPGIGGVAGEKAKGLAFDESTFLLAKLVWLEEGPDTYDTIQETIAAGISGAQELRKTYSPFLIWGATIFNANSAGGANLILKFVDVQGNFKQYKLPGNANISLSLKGGLGSVLRYATDGTATVDMRAFILLKAPFRG